MNIQPLKKELVCGIIILLFGTSFPFSLSAEYNCDSPSTTIDRSTKICGLSIYHGSLSGLVTDAGMNPLQDVKVRVFFHDTYRENDTDVNGYYKVTDIPVCAEMKNIICTKLGYYPSYALLNINESTTHGFIQESMPVYPEVGLPNENGWYTSGVAISFHFNGTVNHPYYAINEDPWIEYTGSPISISQDGIYVLHWYWIDKQGNSSPVFWVGFKIDKTAPFIDLTVTSLNHFRRVWLLNATTFDATSGIAKVDFYVDDVLVGTVNRAPFEYLYQGRGRVCQAIAYDHAGNSGMTIPPALMECSQDFQQNANPSGIQASGDRVKGSEATMYHNVLSGHVTDAGMHPLQGARVRVSFHDTYLENYTDATGYYKVTDIPSCACIKSVTCTKLGYYTNYSVVEGSTQDFLLDPMPVYPVLSGTMGENGWFVSTVGIGFAGNESNHTYYAFDEDPWTEYTGPISMNQDGIHVLHWLCPDEQGNPTVFWVGFKIDRTSPNVTFFSAERLALKVWKFSTNASDNTSGINRVDIWCDYQILRSYTGPPYEVAWVGWSFLVCWKFGRTGDWGYLPHCIPYDNAGNTPMSPMKK